MFSYTNSGGYRPLVLPNLETTEPPMNLEIAPADTLPEAAQVQFEIFRRMSPNKRLQLALRMGDSLRQVVAAGVRHRQPEISEDQVRRIVIHLTLGEELFRQANPGHESHVMTQEEFLTRVAHYLDAAGIPFMVAGSIGSSYHGQPRSTNDVDLVIDPTAAQLDHFLALLGDAYYVRPEAARAALQRRSLFNVIDLAEGWKADLIIRKDRPFSVEEFRRRQMATLHGQALPFASPEDVILTKLECNQMTPFERQLRDALNVAVVQGTRLDQAYLRQWAPQLGVAEQLEELLRKAGEGQRL